MNLHLFYDTNRFSSMRADFRLEKTPLKKMIVGKPATHPCQPSLLAFHVFIYVIHTIHAMKCKCIHNENTYNK